MWKVTTKVLEEIRRLNEEGLTDGKIGEVLGFKQSTIRMWRNRMGLRTNQKQAQYTIYNRDGSVRAFGNADQCAKAMGIAPETVYRYAYLSKRRGDGRVVKEEGCVPEGL